MYTTNISNLYKDLGWCFVYSYNPYRDKYFCIRKEAHTRYFNNDKHKESDWTEGDSFTEAQEKMLVYENERRINCVS